VLLFGFPSFVGVLEERVGLAPIASPVRFARVQRKSFCGVTHNKRLQCIAGLAPKIQTIEGLRFMKCFKFNILKILMVETYFFKFSED
jgi:hypothetical protein